MVKIPDYNRPLKIEDMADIKEQDMNPASDCAWIRGLDGNGNSIRINKTDFIESVFDLIRGKIKVGGRNLLLDSGTEKYYDRFISIPVREILSNYVNQEIVVSFDIKASISRVIQMYPYQYAGISIEETVTFTPSTEYQRFSFLSRVKNHEDKPGMTLGDIAIYDYTGANSLAIKNIKIELGNIPTDWTPAVEEMIN